MYKLKCINLHVSKTFLKNMPFFGAFTVTLLRKLVTEVRIGNSNLEFMITASNLSRASFIAVSPIQTIETEG